jgi:hypothetical protein
LLSVLSVVSASRIDFTSATVRRVKMFFTESNPGRGSVLGIPPVARTSLV